MKQFLLLCIFLPGFAWAQDIRVIDGDTLEISGEKIRLIGIDAPEMHKCKKSGCIPIDPIKSKQNLENLVAGAKIEITRHGTDVFGRTLANVSANGTDLACWQLKNNLAIYVEKWDKSPKVEKRCAQILHLN